MVEIEYRSDLEYEVQTDCHQHKDGWDFLKPFVESSTTFFKLLGAEVIFKEFWKDNEGNMFEPHIVGYNITVIFYGQGSHITRFIGAATLFFDLNNAVKTKEDLYFVPKNEHD